MNGFLRQTMLVARREWRMLMTTPMFWVLSGVFFLLSALVFIGLVLGFADPEMRQQKDMSADVTIAVVQQLFWVLHYFLMMQAPLLTMRALAEERRLGTLNLLQTTPVGEWSIVLGKFVANAGALCAYMLVTLVFPLMIEWISDPDWPVILSCYAALLLSTCGYVAIGIFFSALTESQVIAAVLTYVALFALLILSTLSESFRTSYALTQLAQHLTLMAHVDGFLSGSIGAIHVAYFVLFSFAFLFCAVRMLESSRWRN